ncbi:hypothetical protein ABT081_17150 [Streptomyces sp. NPDC002238]|uniref:hypothetical protein n=1 Tax=Streptomyces sp. NPDC002238 TaxID=3156649 RepID=UPI00332FFCA3
MAVQNSTVERPAPTAPVLTPADVAAHQAASYVRRPVVVPAQESPTPPSEPAARRRFIQQREW